MPWPYNGTTSRALVTGTRAMVSSAHPQASLAGVQTLASGGNAVDAAIAVSAALDVCEPFMSGLGGGGAMLIHVPGEAPTALHYGGYFPEAASLASLTKESIDVGPKAAVIPGAPAGWLTAHARYGCKPIREVFAPAIARAEHGFALSRVGNGFFKAANGRVRGDAREVFFDGSDAPGIGAIIKQPRLAETYRALADGGIDRFYSGDIGQVLVAAVSAAGGLMTLDDLARPQAYWATPGSSRYRDYTVVSTGAPFTSYEIQFTLNLLQQGDLGQSLEDADLWHARIEAAKLSMAERVARGGDLGDTVTGLLHPDYAEARHTLIRNDATLTATGERYTDQRTGATIVPGSPEDYIRECTTHFDVVDESGMAVSVTQTLGSVFGSGFMAGETGIMLNNLMFFFDLDANSPMSIELGEMRSGPLSPTMLFNQEQLFLAIGTPGAFGIPQTTMQMISNVVDLGYSAQAAIEAPRFRLYGGRRVGLEARVKDSVVQALKKRGHEVQTIGAWSPAVGGGQGVLIDPDTGALSGGADPRRDGYSIGF